MGLAIQIEDMAYEAESLSSMALAVYEAIYNGTTSYKEFDGALNTVFRMAHDHMAHMKDLTDKAYALQRESCKEASNTDAGMEGGGLS